MTFKDVPGSVRLLMLPCDDGFYELLGSLFPPGWKQKAAQHSGEFTFVVDPATHLKRVENSRGTTEYLLGGEYDEIVESDLGLQVEEDPEMIMYGVVETTEEGAFVLC